LHSAGRRALESRDREEVVRAQARHRISRQQENQGVADAAAAAGTRTVRIATP
jgi:hypothetical protein